MNAHVKSKIETTKGSRMERGTKKYGEVIAIIPINYNPPLTRCSLCVRQHDFSLMRRNKSGEIVCNKCVRQTRATIHAPTTTEIDNRSKRNTSRLEYIFGKSIGNLKKVMMLSVILLASI